MYPKPLALSLSKGRPSLGAKAEGQGFDKLSPSGIWDARRN